MNLYDYDTWKELLFDDAKRRSWVDFCRKSDPMFSAVMDFCDNKKIDDISALELAIIALINEKVKKITEEWENRSCHTTPTN